MHPVNPEATGLAPTGLPQETGSNDTHCRAAATYSPLRRFAGLGAAWRRVVAKLVHALGRSALPAVLRPVITATGFPAGALSPTLSIGEQGLSICRVDLGQLALKGAPVHAFR